MSSLNVAMIQDLANQKYGFSLDTQSADQILGYTGGDQGKVESYLGMQKANKAVADQGNPDTLIANAQKLLQFQQQANQPVVSALQTAKSKLDDTYQKLVDSIKGNQQVATNQQTLATNNELARRGLSTSSGLGAQDLTNALLPVNTAFAGQLVNAEQGYNQDAINLALQLAGAQAGNPLEAISGATNLSGIQQNAANQAAQLAYNMYARLNPTAQEQAQTNYYNAQTQSLLNPATTQEKLAVNSIGKTLYITDPYTGQVINTLRDQFGGSSAKVDDGW